MTGTDWWVSPSSPRGVRGRIPPCPDADTPPPSPARVPGGPLAGRGRRGGRGEGPEPAAIAAGFGDDMTARHLPPAGTARRLGTPTLRGSTSLLTGCWPLHPTRGRLKVRLR